MAFHTTVYLSPFLEDKDAFWEPAMFLITRRKRSRAVTKSRLCLRLAEKVLPSLTMVAIERAATVTPLFSELMADVIAEEVRSAFIDQVMDITRVDMWTKHVLVRRAQSLGLHSFYPARYSMNLLVRTKAKEAGITDAKAQEILVGFSPASSFHLETSLQTELMCSPSVPRGSTKLQLFDHLRIISSASIRGRS
ncbi:hypothetical protein HPB48_002397 [Haemaphysalis longicornis]|uniref:Uncharacterized protein n=1 Tax=Haemaphysalis longicornis TaxID=44386 RepID=A0A9J6G8Q8_HAELO|nr:hypothetical protein HPB48_002397 [Haemaphysalis longicornis]